MVAHGIHRMQNAAMPPCFLIASNPVAPSTSPATQNDTDNPLPTGVGSGDEPGVSVPPVLTVD
jgi:hypothetical protein